MRDDEVPLFWACGVTPQSVVLDAKPSLCITHAPGHMLVTDLRNAAWLKPRFAGRAAEYTVAGTSSVSHHASSPSGPLKVPPNVTTVFSEKAGTRAQASATSSPSGSSAKVATIADMTPSCRTAG